MGHFSTTFKESNTIILCKPKKPNYSITNAYRPIALECTLEKSSKVSSQKQSHTSPRPTSFSQPATLAANLADLQKML
jgi:hypothetical protein